VGEARPLLVRLHLVHIDFRPDLPLSPLHWILSDGRESVVIESTQLGLRCYDAPLGVLSNEPPYPQLPCPDAHAAALPGDWSSTARYRRAIYVKRHMAVQTEGPGPFFHLLDSVAVPRGPVRTDAGCCHFTRYSSCCDTAAGIYYYTTYENRSITALSLHSFDPEGDRLICRPLRKEPEIRWEH
jgi:choloylglycine hydrolase